MSCICGMNVTHHLSVKKTRSLTSHSPCSLQLPRELQKQDHTWLELIMLHNELSRWGLCFPLNDCRQVQLLSFLVETFWPVSFCHVRAYRRSCARWQRIYPLLAHGMVFLERRWLQLQPMKMTNRPTRRPHPGASGCLCTCGKLCHFKQKSR